MKKYLFLLTKVIASVVFTLLILIASAFGAMSSRGIYDGWDGPHALRVKILEKNEHFIRIAIISHSALADPWMVVWSRWDHVGDRHVQPEKFEMFDIGDTVLVKSKVRYTQLADEFEERGLQIYQVEKDRLDLLGADIHKTHFAIILFLILMLQLFLFRNEIRILNKRIKKRITK